MIEQKLTTYFKRFTAISPSEAFVARSRATVTGAAQMPMARTAWARRMIEAFTTSGALALASFLLLIVLGSISYVAQKGGAVATASFNDAALVREATQLSFQVQLKEAQYFDESASQVVRALDRLSSGGRELQ